MPTYYKPIPGQLGVPLRRPRRPLVDLKKHDEEVAKARAEAVEALKEAVGNAAKAASEYLNPGSIRYENPQGFTLWTQPEPEPEPEPEPDEAKPEPEPEPEAKPEPEPEPKPTKKPVSRAAQRRRERNKSK